ncbi:hypothetical protein L1987_82060 [Smallanthus sonchifolius]|uniref:Uncharacterized protein n=1 Tax=Smallanthus sonchifolius TaxID=185202 RepID=A0ACB8YSF9_9ASTR|nr:hypothetical protein L1987_82060 [Smallanthus sonchifolius]
MVLSFCSIQSHSKAILIPTSLLKLHHPCLDHNFDHFHSFNSSVSSNQILSIFILVVNRDCPFQFLEFLFFFFIKKIPLEFIMFRYSEKILTILMLNVLIWI